MHAHGNYSWVLCRRPNGGGGKISLQVVYTYFASISFNQLLLPPSSVYYYFVTSKFVRNVKCFFFAVDLSY